MVSSGKVTSECFYFPEISRAGLSCEACFQLPVHSSVWGMRFYLLMYKRQSSCFSNPYYNITENTVHVLLPVAQPLSGRLLELSLTYSTNTYWAAAVCRHRVGAGSIELLMEWLLLSHLSSVSTAQHWPSPSCWHLPPCFTTYRFLPPTLWSFLFITCIGCALSLPASMLAPGGEGFQSSLSLMYPQHSSRPLVHSWCLVNSLWVSEWHSA